MRGESRLRQWVNIPRATSPFIGLCTLLACVAVVAGSSDAGLRVAVALLTLGTLALGRVVLQRGNWRPFVLQAMMAAFVGFLYLADASESVRSPSLALLDFAIVAVAFGGILCFLLSLLRILGPLPAGIAMASTSLALVAGAISLEIVSPREHQPAENPKRTASVASVDWQALVPYELCWLGAPGIELPEGIEYVCRPFAAFGNIYPTNPRGYFKREPFYGAIDNRMGTLVTIGADAEVSWPRETGGVVRIKPTQIEPQEAWRLGIQYSNVPILNDCRYLVSLEARADEQRDITIRCLDAKSDFAPLDEQHRFEVDSDWKMVSFEMLPKTSTPFGLLTIDVGSSAVPLEIRNLRVDPIWPEFLDPKDPRLWHSGRQYVNSSSGDLSVQWSPDRSGSGGRAPLERDICSLAAGQKYGYYLRAHGATPRAIKLSVGKSDNADTDLGLAKEIDLGTEWQELGGEFVATADVVRPVLRIDPLESDAPFEIADCRVWPIAGAPSSQIPQRYVVHYQLNSHGFRDREYNEEAPAKTYRIACLGDSFTFGQGVHDADVYVRQLETLLQSKGYKVEVMNFGVSGYSTRQERICFEQEVAKYKPDLVLVAMVTNDNLTIRQEKELGINRSYRGATQLVDQLKEKVFHRSHGDFGYEVCAQELKQLQADCAAQNARLAVVIFANQSGGEWGMLEEAVREGLAGLPIPILSLAEVFGPLPSSVLQVHEVDAHPNEIAHAIAARTIADFLVREGLLPATPPEDSRDR